jgi:MFS family permease
MQILTTLNPETLNYQSRTSQDFVRSCGPIKWLLIISVIYATCFLYGLDTTITGAMQAPIVKDFNSISKLGWVGIGFPLGSIVTILPLGKAFGVFDCKVLYVGSVVLFEVGSALCGGAKGMNSLIVGRVFAGSGKYLN